MRPSRDGWRVIETARAEGIGTPIVVVSARGTEHDRIHALEIGADDYLVKPFSMKELVARVRAASRRSIRREETPRGEPIQIEELRIDPLQVQALVHAASAELTPSDVWFARCGRRSAAGGRVTPSFSRATASGPGSSRCRKKRPSIPRSQRLSLLRHQILTFRDPQGGLLSANISRMKFAVVAHRR